MLLDSFIQKIHNSPDSIQFNETMAVIEELYEFTPTSFTNGELTNAAGENSGSCKLFAFAQLQDFSKEQTLQCFGDYYRVEVLPAPEGTNHQNIRNFIKTGWNGLKFDAQALKLK